MAETLFEDCLWTVAEYGNSLRKRSVKAVRADEVLAAKYGHKMNVFNSEREAVDFMIDRAEKKVEAAEKELKSEQDALKRLRVKFGRGPA